MISRRILALSLVALIGSSIVGCTSAPIPSVSSTADTPSASALPSADEPGPLPSDLAGLRKVSIDARRGRTATVDASGGSVTATAVDGTTYTLSVPAGAISNPTLVGLYPVTSLATLPGGASLVAGVQFTPDGLLLHAPATLKIDLPAGVDTRKLGGISWHGDGQRVQRYPALLAGHPSTMPIFHFSGAGLSLGEIALAVGCGGVPDREVCLTDAFVERWVSEVQQPSPRSALLTDLKDFYHNVVAPTLLNGRAEALQVGAGSSPTREDEMAAPYDGWLMIIGYDRLALHDPTFTVSPELADSKAPATNFLRQWYDAENAACLVAAEDVNVRTPIFWAETALSEAKSYATSWDVATTANLLDLRTLLDDLCVQVVIDPSRSYSAVAAGDSGLISIKAGFSIGGGPLRSAPNPIRVTVRLTGTNTVLGDRDTDADGTFSVPDVVWPDGVDPMQIDVLATLIDNVGGNELPSQIARFDRITKPAEKLEFTFDTDLEGWTKGVAGLKGSDNWGTVYQLPRNGGIVQLDGTGAPGLANAWISKSIALPNLARKLTFDVSAHDRANSDSHFTVRLIDDSSDNVVVDRIVFGVEGSLSFTPVSVDISAWAGRTVTLVFAQDDNGVRVGNKRTFPGGDEQILLDNIRIVWG